MRERRRVGATNRILPSRHVELVHFPQKSQRNQDTPQRYRRSTVHHHRSPYLTGQDKTVSSVLGSIIRSSFSKKEFSLIKICRFYTPCKLYLSMNMSFIHVGWSITLLSCGTSESYATQKMLNVLIIPLLAEVFTRSQPLNHQVI